MTGPRRWQGNIREFRNVIERAAIECCTTRLSAADLPAAPYQLGNGESAFLVPLGSSLSEIERELISRTLASVGGNKAHACAILGISRRNLYNRLVKYGLHRMARGFMRERDRDRNEDSS